MHRTWYGLLAVVAAASVHLATGVAQAQDTRSYILTTATTGGTYYPVGVAIATLIKVKLEPGENVSMSAISSAGSGENVKLLRENQAQFGILQGLFGAWAADGTGMLEAEGPQPHLRSISMLWVNVEHFVVSKDMAKTGTVDDLKEFGGAAFSIGARNSGTEGSGRTILAGLGIDPEAVFDIAYMGYTPTAEALQNGTIEGANMPGGVPVSAVAQAFAAMGDDLVILEFTEEQVARANSEFDLWPPYEIPANTYPRQTEAAQLPRGTRRHPRRRRVSDHQDHVREPAVPPQHPRRDQGHGLGKGDRRPADAAAPGGGAVLRGAGNRDPGSIEAACLSAVRWPFGRPRRAPPQARCRDSPPIPTWHRRPTIRGRASAGC
jgi:TRAP transporter TAXI family solute receptor